MIGTVISYFRDRGQFKDRILKRHEIFWEDKHAERIRNINMSRHDPIEK
ncbi:MAG: hypothetical protein JKY70_21545 [Mucilaginibacter sp.]|nr:hypothetical protein [Mucilaginibacter sp.]